MTTGGESLTTHSGASLLRQTADIIGLTKTLSQALSPWRAPLAIHDPGKIVLDLTTAIALGGDCLADLAAIRAQPALFGHVASDPTVSRLITRLAADAPAALAALRAAHAITRQRVWSTAQVPAPIPQDGPVIVDLDATILAAHSDKEGATSTWKRTFGFHPILAFVDHGPGGTGEYVGGTLRIGRATANDAGAHINLTTDVLAQLPEDVRNRVMIRGDAGAGVKEFIWHLHNADLSYSIGLQAGQRIAAAIPRVPRQAWRAAIDPDGSRRDGAQVADISAWIEDLAPSWTARPWPPGMRIIARRERPNPGAQLGLTDVDGWRITIFATNISGGRVAEHELTHRLRARAEDRIRCLKDTGARNLPLHSFAANQIWLQIVGLANDLIAWTQHLALSGTPARCWEPKTLRLRLFAVAGRLVSSARRRTLRLARDWPWSQLLLTGQHRLAALSP
ncbi:IS1380 family transposase [Kineococcus sp. NBC_00420]